MLAHKTARSLNTLSASSSWMRYLNACCSNGSSAGCSRASTSSDQQRQVVATIAARSFSGKSWIPDCSMDTHIVHGGVTPDEKTGAILTPVYMSTTFVQESVDKYLDNFWHIGLLKLMFPEAKVIHCVRDPLDNAMSIYRQSFSDPGPTFACDLAEIGAYFKMHDSLLRHWDEVLPGFVRHVRYEDIVGALEPGARDLLAFCDLPWDERCLDFHRTERPVRTASHAQVRQPLYRNAIGSAQPYLAHLSPLIEALR